MSKHTPVMGKLKPKPDPRRVPKTIVISSDVGNSGKKIAIALVATICFCASEIAQASDGDIHGLFSMFQGYSLAVIWAWALGHFKKGRS